MVYGRHLGVAQPELVRQRVLHRQHAAEQRRVARRLLTGAQIEHELLERHVLVLVRVHRPFGDALEQLAERRIAVEARPHREDVREVADQPFDFVPRCGPPIGEPVMMSSCPE